MTRTPAEVGEIVRARREALGLTQEGIPNVSSSLVRTIERGTASLHGRGLTRGALMEALDWPADALGRLAAGEAPESLERRLRRNVLPEGGQDFDPDDDPDPGGASAPATSAEVAELRQEVAELTELLMAALTGDTRRLFLDEDEPDSHRPQPPPMTGDEGA